MFLPFGKNAMRNKLTCIILLLVLSACTENSYDRHSETDEIPADSLGGFQTGTGTESVADPNAANTKRTPVPLDSVVVDTTASEGK